MYIYIYVCLHRQAYIFSVIPSPSRNRPRIAAFPPRCSTPKLLDEATFLDKASIEKKKKKKKQKNEQKEEEEKKDKHKEHYEGDMYGEEYR